MATLNQQIENIFESSTSTAVITRSLRALGIQQHEISALFFQYGVLSITPYKGKTDSETAFLKYIYPAIMQGGLDSSECDTAVYNTIESSRFAIMQGEDVRLFGQFLTNEGCFYSNFRFAHYLYN